MPFSLASTSAFTAVARKLRLVPEAVLAATLRARIGCAPATSVAVASLVGTETIRFLAVGRRARPRRGYPFRGLWPRHRLATGPRQCGENAGPRPVAVMSRSSIPPGAIATSPDDLLIRLGALAIGQATGREIPPSSKVILRRRSPRENRQDRRPPPQNATGHRNNRVGLSGSGTTPARLQQGLPSMWFPISARRPCSRTGRP